MARLETSRLKLSHGWFRGEDWWGDPVSRNFVLIDMLMNPVIVSMTESEPPQNGVTVGDMYIIAPGATDAWLDHDGDLAVRGKTGWIFATPTEGVRARLKNPAGWIWFNGTTWVGEDQETDDGPAPLGTRYDISVSVGYEAVPGEVLLAFTFPEAMTLPNAAPGSAGRALNPPPGVMRLPVKRNGTDVAAITFVPNDVRAEIAVVGDKVFAAGDLLTVHVPNAPPAGFEAYSATLRFLLQTNGG